LPLEEAIAGETIITYILGSDTTREFYDDDLEVFHAAIDEPYANEETGTWPI
jgi:hypothetical protein